VLEALALVAGDATGVHKQRHGRKSRGNPAPPNRQSSAVRDAVAYGSCVARSSATSPACPQKHRACSRSFKPGTSTQRCRSSGTCGQWYATNPCVEKSPESPSHHVTANVESHSITPRRSLRRLLPEPRAEQCLSVGHFSMQISPSGGSVFSANQHAVPLRKVRQQSSTQFFAASMTTRVLCACTNEVFLGRSNRALSTIDWTREPNSRSVDVIALDSVILPCVGRADEALD
jgi:hypothetical protein